MGSHKERALNVLDSSTLEEQTKHDMRLLSKSSTFYISPTSNFSDLPRLICKPSKLIKTLLTSIIKPLFMDDFKKVLILLS